MKKSKILFEVALDEKNIPESIEWSADEKPEQSKDETSAIALSVWDNKAKNTLRMDLWTKEMSVDEMKKFVVDSIGGMATTVRNSTDDQKMADHMDELCQVLVKHIEEEKKDQK
jgi:gliding motility-associated protein GldC